MGSPPMVPDTTLATPCPINSRLKSVRGPLCILSTETADSRLSTLAMSATVITPITIAPQLPSGSAGNCSASKGDPSRSIRRTLNGKTTETAVTATIATSGPGMRATRAGTQRHAIIMAITSTPRMTPGRCAPMTWPGSSMTLCQAELLDFPPSSTWACCSAIVIPMPASIACTTTGEIASAARATRLSPNRTCRTPAATVIKHVTAQPKSDTRSAITTVSPAAGPLTCSGEPPIHPTMIPPTIAAIRPASTGAFDAIAIPSDNGSATRKTTSDEGKSCRITERNPNRARVSPRSKSGWPSRLRRCSMC
jgi:hypothetical protein